MRVWMCGLSGLFAVWLSGVPAWATVYWADPAGSNSATCSNIDSVGTADDPGTDPASYGTIGRAANCATVAGDVVNIKAGTYSGANNRIKTDAETTGLASGTSDSVRTYIQGDPSGARPLIQTTQSAWATTYLSTARRNYLTFRHLTIDGQSSGTTNQGFYFKGHHYLIEDVEILNMSGSGMQVIQSDAALDHHLTVRRTLIHNVGTSGVGYGCYCNWTDVLFEYNEVYSFRGGGLQTVGGGGTTGRGTIQYNYFHDAVTSNISQCWGLAVSGTGNLLYRNILDLSACTGSPSGSGVDHYGVGTVTNRVFHNTIKKANGYGIQLGLGGTSSGTLHTNNIILGWTSAAVQKWNSATSTETTNKTTGSQTDCTPSTSTFTQKAGSSCINAGTAISGFAANGVPDIGVAESFGFSFATVNENVMDVTAGMNLHTPIQPGSGQTTWTALVSAVARGTVGASLLTSTSSVTRVTFDGAVCTGGQTWTVTYVVGNVTDSMALGGPTANINQPMTAFAAQAVTNGCGATPPATPGTPLISYNFDENTGTTAADGVGGDQAGTLTNGPTWEAPGKHGASAVHFVASGDDLVAVPYGSGLNPTTASWTNCMGVKFDVGTETGTNIYAGAPNGTNQRMYLGSLGGTWGQGVQASGFTSNPEFPVVAGYTRICQRVNSTSDIVSLAVNGVVGASAESNKAVTSYTLSGNFNLGTHQVTGGQPGVTIDDFIHYDGLLSDADILTDFQAWEPESPPATCTLAQPAHQWHLLRQTSGGAVENYGALSATVPVVVGGAVMLTIQTDATVAGCTLAQRLRYNVDGGAFLEVPDVMGPDGVAFYGSPATTDPDILKGAVTALLTGALTKIDGATQIDAQAVPIIPFTTNSSSPQRYVLRFDTTAAGTICFKAYNQTGEAYGTYTPTAGACVTITGMRAGTGF